ncbi:cytochrome C oxidase subunit IV family protein [Silvibacterium sp.]|uniref:cytochrome C oxidase subunit IV family protein n=1 Tax=Silvibacterium sp. TaxID=1964179 RepID=UPI0039E31CF9
MSESAHHDQQVSSPHIINPIEHFFVCVTLLVGTAITVGTSYLNLHVFNAVIAIGVAVIEAVLVVLYLMHVKDSSRLTKLTIGAGIFTFLVLIGMSLTDYIARAWGNW